ncbi:hypothetical protein Y1Q_0023438 [Alligator mississippiensis]|uniref:Uncharacterized protein n=1 Tax=Alligator mississippiensis TaxID=8496 RepID=A0A151NQH7_ALLMI|nr:hypothetical protein Y1Q_0023438 [Alligator mississippiensis]
MASSCHRACFYCISVVLREWRNILEIIGRYDLERAYPVVSSTCKASLMGYLYPAERELVLLNGAAWDTEQQHMAGRVLPEGCCAPAWTLGTGPKYNTGYKVDPRMKDTT